MATQKELAENAGVSVGTINNTKKSLKIVGKTMTKEEEELVLRESKKISQLQSEKNEKLKKTSKGFKPKVREIDKSEDSSISDVLQDCKEQYVKNEALIQRLQYEISEQDILMNGHKNGTLSLLPQLKALESFQKINISLRNQIISLEDMLGRTIKAEKDENPFN